MLSILIIQLAKLYKNTDYNHLTETDIRDIEKPIGH